MILNSYTITQQNMNVGVFVSPVGVLLTNVAGCFLYPQKHIPVVVLVLNCHSSL